jgi:hypothetical protein
MISTRTVPTNAKLLIRDNLDPDSNVTEESDLHPEKQFSPNTPTDAGITISSRPISLNANPQIRDNLEPDSNVTEERNRQPSKHP